MKRTVFIFHGTGGHPKENWFPWLKKKLTPLGCRVIIPQFPTPKNQTLAAWRKTFEKYRKFLNGETILIGHSLGGTFALRILEKLDSPVRAAFLVATPLGVLPVKFHITDRPFTKPPFRWAKIRKNCRRFFVFQSEDDPYVSANNGKKLAKALHIKLILAKRAGHYNKAAGYTEFPTLLTKIQKLLR